MQISGFMSLGMIAPTAFIDPKSIKPDSDFKAEREHLDVNDRKEQKQSENVLDADTVSEQSTRFLDELMRSLQESLGSTNTDNHELTRSEQERQSKREQYETVIKSKHMQHYSKRIPDAGSPPSASFIANGEALSMHVNYVI